MRFVWAVAAFVLAAVMIGAGIAQRTVFQGPDDRDGGDLGLGGGAVPPDRRRRPQQLPGAQTLRAQGDGDIFAAYGRTADLEAWLADTDYNAVTLSSAGRS